MPQSYDVIIVGAGPAGSSAAYNITRFLPDANVLLIDKQKFPRDKPCGGGLSPEVANYFDFSIDEAIDFVCDEVVMHANKQEFQSHGYPLWMVRREKFDNFLLNKAKERGVDTITGCEVLNIENLKEFCLVTTSKETYHTKVVVLAEGSRGKLAKRLGYSVKNKIFAALEYEHYTKELDGKLYIDFDSIKNGYAWNFPKSDGLSLGAGGMFKGQTKKSGLPKQIADFSQKFGVEEIDKDFLQGHPINAYNGKRNLVYNRVMLVGEIAGAVDPLTAEGIRPSIKSGYLLAEVVAEYLNSNRLKILKKYNKKFHTEIGKDFHYANIMAYFLYKYYKKIVPIIASKRAIDSFMSVFSGTSTYREKIHPRRILTIIKNIILPS